MAGLAEGRGVLHRSESLSRFQTKLLGQILVSECIAPQSGFHKHYFIYINIRYVKRAGAEQRVNRILLLLLCWIISLRASGRALPQLRRFEASAGSMVTQTRFDVAAGDLRHVGGQEPSTEPRQMINNRDLADDVCSSKPFPSDFFSLRGSWSKIVMFSCQRSTFICLFSRVLKVVCCLLCKRAFRPCVCVCMKTKELTLDDAKKRGRSMTSQRWHQYHRQRGQDVQRESKI